MPPIKLDIFSDQVLLSFTAFFIFVVFILLLLYVLFCFLFNETYKVKNQELLSIILFYLNKNKKL